MSRRRRTVTASVLCTMMGGCAGLIPDIDFPIPLNGALGTFQVEAGAPLAQRGTAEFDLFGLPVGSGSLKIDIEAVSVAPAAVAEGEASAIPPTVQIVVWISSIDDLETVCETGDRHPQASTDPPGFVLILDRTGFPVSVTPERVDLEPGAVEAVRSGEASLCIEVTSSISGIVTINSLTLGVGL